MINPLFESQYVRHSDSPITTAVAGTANATILVPPSNIKPKFAYIYGLTGNHSVEASSNGKPDDPTLGSRRLLIGTELKIQFNSELSPSLKILSIAASTGTVIVVWSA